MSSQTAAEIVKSVGGAANIAGLSHCATRLRFQLRDASNVTQSAIEAVPGVLGAVPQAGDRYQVVIGGGGAERLQRHHGVAGHERRRPRPDADAIKAAARAQGPRGKFTWLDSFFEFLSDSFRPILGALLGASLFITFMALMSTLRRHPELGRPARPNCRRPGSSSTCAGRACSCSCR